MKKIFKKIKLRDIIFTTLGLIVGGGIFGTLGIVATTNKLEAKYVMYTKDGKTMTVQDAIKDLYIKSSKGSNQTLPLGDVTASGTQITIPYTGSYSNVICLYGTNENYGSVGTISGSTCIFSGGANTTYYYKLIAINNTGIIYENSGNKATNSESVKPNNMTLSSNSDSTYTQTKSVTVTLKDTGGSGLASGSIKYGWSASTTTAPSSYTTVITNATTGENTTTFTANGSGLTGSYYLWVVPISYKDTAGNANTTTIISTGTFNFDNKGPEAWEGTIGSSCYNVYVNFNVSDDVGISKYHCGNGVWASPSKSSIRCYSDDAGSNEKVQVCIYMMDKLGNTSSECVWEWTDSDC